MKESKKSRMSSGFPLWAIERRNGHQLKWRRPGLEQVWRWGRYGIPVSMAEHGIPTRCPRDDVKNLVGYTQPNYCSRLICVWDFHSLLDALFLSLESCLYCRVLKFYNDEWIFLLSLLEQVNFWSIIPFNSKPWSLSMTLCCRLFRINKNEWVESFGIPFPKEPLWKMRNCPMINTWITGKSSDYSYFDTTTMIQYLISQKPSSHITYLMALLHKLLSRDFLAQTHLSLIIDTHNNLTGVICFLHAILKHISF